MPIIDVEIVLRPDETIREEIAAELAEALGDIFRSSRDETWLKLYPLLAGRYAENGGTPEGVSPVFVTILRSRLPSVGEMQEEVKKIVAAVAELCDRPPENVHVIYQPEARGRVAFGGKLVY